MRIIAAILMLLASPVLAVSDAMKRCGGDPDCVRSVKAQESSPEGKRLAAERQRQERANDERFRAEHTSRHYYTRTVNGKKVTTVCTVVAYGNYSSTECE